jgi:F420-non-reducing hydrogenase large subunit
MKTLTLEPIRWQDDPARITVQADGTTADVYYQTTSPRLLETICPGRPVEELPRILTMLAPAHHLTAAQALDRLFEVKPPELARHMRSALLQAQFGAAHLRKFYFLLTGCHDPLADFHVARKGALPPMISRQWLQDIARHVALAQEAEEILGGRCTHPLTATTGGVSRFLKEGHYDRLSEICGSLLPFVQKLAQWVRSTLLAGDTGNCPWADIEIPKLAGLYMAADGRTSLGDPDGGGAKPLPEDRLDEVIALHREAWTYQPFACLKEQGWQDLDHRSSFFHVGPLARFNADLTAATSLAEEERQRVIAVVGAPPVFSWSAVFGAMAVELIQSVEQLQELSRPEKLAGPALRTIPKRHGTSTWARLEAPQGLTWHAFSVDEEGIVQTATVLDAGTANHALKCLLAQQVVTAELEKQTDPKVIKERVELALLPF